METGRRVVKIQRILAFVRIELYHIASSSVLANSYEYDFELFSLLHDISLARQITSITAIADKENPRLRRTGFKELG